MDVFGFSIPLWLVFSVGIIIILVAWKFIKFAIKILLILMIFFAILIALDFFNVFGLFQDLLSKIV